MVLLKNIFANIIARFVHVYKGFLAFFYVAKSCDFFVTMREGLAQDGRGAWAKAAKAGLF